MNRLRTLAAPILAVALLGSACGGTREGSFDVGLQRVAVDLAFKDGDPMKAPPPAFALGPIGLGPNGDVNASIRRLADLPIVSPVECPAAAANAFPPDAVTTAIETLVTPGRYVYRDVGDFEVITPLPLKGTLPPITVRDYRDPALLPQADLLGAAEPPNRSWAVVQPLGGTDFVRRDFVATPTALQLTKLTYKIGSGEFVFAPTPAITLMDLGDNNVAGATWDSAGTDPKTGTVMIVRGGLEARELVDVCGRVFEAYKIRSTERLVSVAGTTPFSSQTEDANDVPGVTPAKRPNRYWVATQYGGQFLAEETHTTSTIGSLTVTINNKATLTSRTARPLPAAP